MTSKRSFLLSLGAGLMVPSFAQNTSIAPKTKGPSVWLDLDQAELDAAYDQSVYAPNLQLIQTQYASNSDLTRRRLGEPQNFSYGPTAFEKLDVFLSPKSNAPINIFIHGGAWRGGRAKDYAYNADIFVNAGAHCVIPDFINVLQANGDLMPMAEQVQRAIAWVYQNAKSFNGDPHKIYLTSHSSGAHLAGVALTTDWEKKYSLPMNMIKGAILCSGMYELKPVRLSARSNYVKFTDEMEEALSSQRHLSLLNTPVIVAHGSQETPEFKRQNREFAKAVKDMGKPVEFIVGQGYNHFEMPQTLANPYGILGEMVLKQMGLS